MHSRTRLAELLDGPLVEELFAILREILEVEDTLEPGMMVSPPHVDSHLMAVRKGRRDAYYLIKNEVELGRHARLAELSRGEEEGKNE